MESIKKGNVKGQGGMFGGAAIILLRVKITIQSLTIVYHVIPADIFAINRAHAVVVVIQVFSDILRQVVI